MFLCSRGLAPPFILPMLLCPSLRTASCAAQMKHPKHIIDPNGDVTITLLNPNAPFAVSEEWDYGEDDQSRSWFGTRQWNPLNNEQAVDSLLDLTIINQDDHDEAPKSAEPETYVSLLAATDLTRVPTRRQRYRPRRMSESECIRSEYTRMSIPPGQERLLSVIT